MTLAPRRILWTLSLLGWATALAAVVATVGLRRAGAPDPVLDDAYMFVRYADNWLAEGRLAWQPGGAPTFGLTSPLFLTLVIPSRLAQPDDPAATAVLASCLAGGLFLGLLVWCLRQWLVDATPAAKLLAWLFSGVALARGAAPLAAHFSTGMDTTFALAYLTAYLGVFGRDLRTGSALSGSGVVLLGGLAFWARPDLLVYTLGVPAVQALLSRSSAHRRRARNLLAGTAAVLALQVGLAVAYFDSPVPLSFYAKSLGLYGERIHREYENVPLQELGRYGVTWAPLLAGIGAGAIAAWVARRRPPAAEIGLLLATAAFLAYYARFVLQIVFYDQRFYTPTLPALALLAALGVARAARELPRRVGADLRRRMGALPPIAWLAPAVALGLALLPLPVWVQLASGIRAGDFARYRFAPGPGLFEFVWVGLDRASRLPADLVIAATEIGHPAIMNPDKVVIDLTGLNETAIARRGFSADRLFERHQPDLIYMPHPDYARMLRDLEGDPFFRENYDHVRVDDLYCPHHPVRRPVVLAVALRRDSRYYDELRRTVDERLARCFRRPHAAAGAGRRSR